ncbi:MAG: hypothetical protein Q7N87_03430 [Candidatus Uhrbacteria bacterium]|nr:hypothetical protein [Candidatus Uhrbacteria bacterium]
MNREPGKPEEDDPTEDPEAGEGKEGANEAEGAEAAPGDNGDDDIMARDGIERFKRREHVMVIDVGIANQGGSPLLLDAMGPQTIVDVLIRGERKPPDRTAPLRDMATKKLYFDPDDPDSKRQLLGFPTMNLLACLAEAARGIKVGRGGISTADTTKLFAFLSIDREFLRFPDGTEWIHDVRRGMQRAGSGPGTAVGIVRPKFKKWTTEFVMTLKLHELAGLTERHVYDMFLLAGAAIGLCSFRGGCRGPFGKFQITKWRVTSVRK